MSSDDWPEWLPGDWMVQIRKVDQRKVKCYVDPEGNKFYSKPQVDRHLQKHNNNTNNADDPQTNEVLETTPQAQSPKLRARSGRTNYKETETDGVIAEDGSSSGHGASARQNGASNWLPEGWITEVKTKSTGSKYKIYIDPLNGRKYFSKPQVLSYLANTHGILSPEPISAVASTLNEDKSSTEPNKPQNHEAEKKTDSVRMSSEYELVSSSPAEGLPPGWVKEIRMRKNSSNKKKDPYYLDPLSGYIFLSKLDALRYLESGDVKKCVMRPMRRDLNETPDYGTASLTGEELTTPPVPSKVTETPIVVPNGSVDESNNNESGTTDKKKRSITGDGFVSTPNSSHKSEVSEWLPNGWVMEVNVKDNGLKVKCFKEIATGKKLYSKPQVLNYLANGTSNNSNSSKRKARKTYAEDDSSPEDNRQKGSKKKNASTLNADFTEEITTCPAEGLPPGWIKEIRIKRYATHERKDPFYTDPVTGYIFRSKLDAIRFLDTGDVSLCAIRPKMKDANGNEVFVTSPNGQKPAKTTPTKQLFEDKQQNEAADPTPVEENNGSSGKATRVTRDRSAKRNNTPPATTPPARTSKRLKGVVNYSETTNEGNGVVHEPEVAGGVNLEKQDGDVDPMSFVEEDANWTDQCLDFAVRTLTSEILGGNIGDAGRDEGSVGGLNETPTKVN